MCSQTRLFIGNLPVNTNENDLKSAFSTFGEVVNLDLKSKSGDELNKKNFAFLSISGSNHSIEACIRHFSHENFQGNKLYVSRARESFLERLERERQEAKQQKVVEDEQPLPKKNPVIKLSEKLNPRKRRLDDHKDVNGYGANHKTILVNNNKNKEEKLFAGDAGTFTTNKKKEDSDKKRMDALKKKRDEYKQKQMIIKTALIDIDKVPNRKTRFSDSEGEPHSTKPARTKPEEEKRHLKIIKEKKTNLFDDDEIESDDDVNFEIKKQFEGKKGQKDEQPLPKKNPVIKLSEKLNPRKRRLDDHKDVNGYGANHKTILVNNNKNKEEKLFAGDAGTFTTNKKKEDSDKKRMDALKKKRDEYKQKQMIIKTGLIGIDKVPNRKTRFSDSEGEPHSTKPARTKPEEEKRHLKIIKEKKTNLFDDDEIESDDDVNFEIKKQFEGKKGQKDEQPLPKKNPVIKLGEKLNPRKRRLDDHKDVNGYGANHKTILVNNNKNKEEKLFAGDAGTFTTNKKKEDSDKKRMDALKKKRDEYKQKQMIIKTALIDIDKVPNRKTRFSDSEGEPHSTKPARTKPEEEKRHLKIIKEKKTNLFDDDEIESDDDVNFEIKKQFEGKKGQKDEQPLPKKNPVIKLGEKLNPRKRRLDDHKDVNGYGANHKTILVNNNKNKEEKLFAGDAGTFTTNKKKEDSDKKRMDALKKKRDEYKQKQMIIKTALIDIDKVPNRKTRFSDSEGEPHSTKPARTKPEEEKRHLKIIKEKKTNLFDDDEIESDDDVNFEIKKQFEGKKGQKDEQPLPKKNPVIKLGEKLNPRKRRLDDHKDVNGYGANHKTILVNNNKNKEEKLFAGDAGTFTTNKKKEDSDKKRMDALKKKRDEYKQKQMIIKTALIDIDKVPNRKTRFSDSEGEPHSTKPARTKPEEEKRHLKIIKEKKTNLFDDDEIESDDDVNFEIKKQFEGKKGQKDEQPLPKKNPVIKLGEKLNPRKRRLDDHKDVNGYGANHKTILVNNNKNKEEKLFAGDAGTFTTNKKKEDSDKKRMDALKKKRDEYKQKQMIIKTALIDIDKVPNRKTRFSDSEGEPHSTKPARTKPEEEKRHLKIIKEKKTNLFDDDEIESDDDVNFEIKKQFEGKKGQKDEQPLPKKNPVIKLSEKLNPRKRRLDDHKDVNGYGANHKTILVNNNKNKEEKLFAGDAGTFTTNKKKEDSDKKRMDALKKKRDEYKQKQMIIKTGLIGIDKVPNRKTRFSDSEGEPHSTKPARTKPEEEKRHLKIIKEKKTNLFDDDEIESDDDVNFEIKKQFEGKKGQKVLDLQSRYKSDKRFVLDERFIEENESDEEYDQKQILDEHEQIDTGEAGEKIKQLNILQDLLGVQIKTKSNSETINSKAKRTNLGMLRFDPTQPEHAKFLAPVQVTNETVKKSKKKKSKEKQEEPQPQPIIEQPKIEVSKEQFYKVSETLKETIAQPTTFSLRSLFGQNEDDNNKKVDANEEEPEYIPLNTPKEKKVKNPFEPAEKNPFTYDSSDSETEDKDEPEVTETIKPEVTKAVWRENFFFADSDNRLKEGLAFFNKSNDNEVHKERRELKSLMKKRIYNNERKNQMFQKKIGGRKKIMKKSFKRKS